jgi:acetyl-CoA synthetase
VTLPAPAFKRDIDSFLAARNLLHQHARDYEAAYASFRWPQLTDFNWAVDYFDDYAAGNAQTALWIVGEDGKEQKLSFQDLSIRSTQVANFLHRNGVNPGDRILVILPNTAAIWETMLAALKIGAVVIPASTLLTSDDLADRVRRGKVSHVIADVDSVERFEKTRGTYRRFLVGNSASGWISYDDSHNEPVRLQSEVKLPVHSPYLLYFTSGTTALPKMVLHTRQSYPVGHLATMYWIGLQPHDVHLNISSPGWAKHAWSSVFAPWNAGATVFVHSYRRFDAQATLEVVAQFGVTSLCAPPTVWRIFVLHDLASYRVKLASLVSAGEPLNPEVIKKVKTAWGLEIRDGYGQSETVALLGNFPGQKLQPGCVGKPTPGHELLLLDASGQTCDEGEICVRLEPRPLSLMAGYTDDPERMACRGLPGDYYRTGDLATRSTDGSFTFVGRGDDVFKSSDYRISPFELESALIEHDCVAEAAVVPSPDSRRSLVPKAFIVLKPGIEPCADVAKDIFVFLRSRLSPYKRIRRLQFTDLPKTISGKIRRGELRKLENTLRSNSGKASQEYLEEECF